MSNLREDIPDEEIQKYINEFQDLNEDALIMELNSKLVIFTDRSPDVKSFGIKLSFDSFIPDLRKVICEDLNYCNNKKDYIEDYKELIYLAVPAIIATAGLSIGPDIACILIFIAIKRGLDILCKCPKKN